MIVAIEGLDGAGKGTLCRLLSHKLQKWSQEKGHPFRLVSFPQYGNTHFAKMVTQFLNGDLGHLASLPVHMTATLYAGDRFESRALFQPGTDRHEIILLDRYVASNMAYHCARCPTSQWSEISDWILEYEMIHLGLPKPDLNILLHSHPDISHYLVAQKERRSYTDKTHDILESQKDLLARVDEAYAFLVQEKKPGPWSVIPIMRAQTLEEKSVVLMPETAPQMRMSTLLRDPQEIADQVWQQILEIHGQNRKESK